MCTLRLVSFSCDTSDVAASFRRWFRRAAKDAAKERTQIFRLRILHRDGQSGSSETDQRNGGDKERDKFHFCLYTAKLLKDVESASAKWGLEELQAVRPLDVLYMQARDGLNVQSSTMNKRADAEGPIGHSTESPSVSCTLRKKVQRLVFWLRGISTYLNGSRQPPYTIKHAQHKLESVCYLVICFHMPSNWKLGAS